MEFLREKVVRRPSISVRIGRTASAPINQSRLTDLEILNSTAEDGYRRSGQFTPPSLTLFRSTQNLSGKPGVAPSVSESQSVDNHSMKQRPRRGNIFNEKITG